MRTHDQVAVSPLRRYGLRSEATATGVVVELDAAAGAPVTLLADLRCHRAWSMLPANATAESPLGLPGVHFDVTGSQVILSVPDPTLVTELQRRVAKELVR